MNNDWYIPSVDGNIGKYKALKHKVTKERCLFGKHGEIWEYSSDTIAVLVKSHKIANKFTDNKAHAGDESLFKAPLTDLSKWVKLIKVPVRYLNKQMEYSEV